MDRETEYTFFSEEGIQMVNKYIKRCSLVICCCCCLVTQACLILVTPWTVACQDPLSMGFPRQEYWSGLPFSSPKDLPDLGIQPASPVFTGGFFTTETPGKPSSDIREIQIKS